MSWPVCEKTVGNVSSVYPVSPLGHYRHFSRGEEQAPEQYSSQTIVCQRHLVTASDRSDDE
jgi:hypothetical protein